MTNLDRNQAVKLLKQRAEAQDNLVTFARLIDIPSVPVAGTENDWEIIDTPLAKHHLLTLYALQSMACGRLLFDPDTLDPITKPTPDGLVWVTPRGGRAGGGVADIKLYDPSGNSPNSELYGIIPPANTHKSPAETTEWTDQKHSEITARTHPQTKDSGTGTDSSSRAGHVVNGSMQDGRSESRSPSLQEHTHSPARTRTKSDESPDGSTSTQTGSITPDEIIIEGEIPDFYTRDLRYEVCRRVLIMQPPGSAKSTYGSVVFPVWDMGRNRDQEIILTGWGDPICRRHGKRARKICESGLYRSIMTGGLDPQTRAAEDWALTNGSTYKSGGINSGVAGFRCDGLIWDDLTKNRKEADSQGIRDDVYNAYIDDARSRKKPDAWEVGIGTRWHEDEIMGRILPEGYSGESGYMRCRDGNVWLVICLAAECEREDDPLGRVKGEMLWQEWFGEEYWREKRVNPRSWASLYQQRPAPEEGIMFKREDFKRYDVLPLGDNWISIDPAVSEEDDADDTAIMVWRVDDQARLYLISRHIMHVTMDKWVAFLLQKAVHFKPIEIVGESGVIRRAAEPWIKRAMIKMKSFFKFEWVHRHANKPAMARGAEAMVASGQVFVPHNSDGDDFIDSCLKFPASKQDHDVDAFVNLCLRLEDIWEANVPKTVTEESPIIGSASISIKSLMPPRHVKRKSRWKRTYRMSQRTR